LNASGLSQPISASLSQAASHKTERNAMALPTGTDFDPNYRRGEPGYRVYPHQTQLLFRSQTLEWFPKKVSTTVIIVSKIMF
jgi:predicted outer membrane protein